MIELYDVIDSLGTALGINGTLMLDRNVSPCNNFPVYERFEYTLFRIDGTVRERLLTMVNTVNTSDLPKGMDRNGLFRLYDRKFMVELFKWLLKKDGYADESIPD